MMLAAIDIGSNAVRFLFGEMRESSSGKFLLKKKELLRMPIRLGEDVFLHQKISLRNEDRMVASIKAFCELKKVFEVSSYRACATSAFRDAVNGKEITERILKETGVEIEIIDGKTEASLILASPIEIIDSKNSYMYIDIGGGSTEITLISNGKTRESRSFNIGTIRMLFDKTEKTEWEDLKQWVKAMGAEIKPLAAIGSGGNVSRLYKMSGKKDRCIPFSKIKEMYEMLSSYTMEERIEILDLNPDRADVILPAAKIVMTVMKQAEIKSIIVPDIGLSDGIIRDLHEKMMSAPQKENIKG